MAHRKPRTEDELQDLQIEILPLTEAFDLVTDHVVITDSEANILYANKGVEATTGFSHMEIIGKNPGDLWGGHMPKEFSEDMWHTIKTLKRPFQGEVENHNKDGDSYWQELRIFPILDHEGEVKFFIAIEPDITVRKVVEGHKQQYMEEMQRLNTYLEERQVKMSELTEEVAKLKAELEKKK